MNEMERPQEPDFDGFLNEAIEQDQAVEKNKNYINELNRLADDKLDALEHVPLEPGSWRYEVVRSTLYDKLYAQHKPEGYTNEQVELEVAYELKELAIREDVYITSAKMMRAGYDAYIDAGKVIDEANFLDVKMSILADMIVVGQYEQNEPVVTFVNEFAPGEIVSFSDMAMQPYFVKSMEKLANHEATTERIRTEMEGAYRAAGINASANDEETVSQMEVIGKMMVQAQIKSMNDNAAATRQEKLLEIARTGGLDATRATSVVAYIETTYPIE